MNFRDIVFTITFLIWLFVLTATCGLLAFTRYNNSMALNFFEQRIRNLSSNDEVLVASVQQLSNTVQQMDRFLRNSIIPAGKGKKKK